MIQNLRRADQAHSGATGSFSLDFSCLRIPAQDARMAARTLRLSANGAA